MSRVRLRDVEPGDRDAFFLHQQDEGARHQAAFVPADPTDRESFEAHWDRVLSRSTWVARTIEQDEESVGHIIKFDADGHPEITYWIDRARWGDGIATEAVRLLLTEIAERPIYARVAADNSGSRRVLEKNGFTEVGRDRGYSNARGEVIDELVMLLGDQQESF